jgi:enterochelin esterase family protein
MSLRLRACLVLVTVISVTSGAFSATAQAPDGPSSWRDHFTSARIEALRRELKAGLTNTEAFWKSVAAQGTPLIEAAANGDQHQLVTFLWRGSSDTKNVLVEIYPFTWERASDYVMQRVGETDVWFLTWRAPRGARFLYRLSPNDPLDNPSVGVLRNSAFQSDPLNPNRWMCGGTAPVTRCYSRVELPGASPQPWLALNPESPAGTLETFRFTSSLLSNERTLAVYTPAGFDRRRLDYPLLVLFDGDAYRNLIPTPTILDNLISARRLPPMVAVFVSNVAGSREQELLFNRAFVDAVASELVPWIRERYPVSTDPRKAVIGGLSAGGAAATYAALRHPNVFGNVIAQSGAFNSSPEQMLDFQQRSPASDATDRHVQEEVEDRGAVEGDWLARQVIALPPRPVRFYLDAGLFESSIGGVTGVLDGTRHFRDVLRAKGYEVHYQMFVGGHDYLSWRGTVADGLLALVGTP